ncbi:phosphatidate cytidylyltransferase [Orrella sp. 11846]|uniref:phosphatidate cytidylyltransferase n=1 Tax=Orrella sp. 11846 TaxID=3409913 RepID=UPI003B5B481E
MLKQRVLTAIILLIILTGVLSNDWRLAWPLFLAILSGLAVWEWWRLAWPTPKLLPVAVGFLTFCGLLYQALQWDQLGGLNESVLSTSSAWFQWAIWFAVFVWIVIVPVYLARGRAEQRADLRWWAWFAPIALYATWGPLAIWHAQGGVWLLLSVLILVWIADIFAYFGGKRWGRNKLAVHISPGKTREGAYTGLTGVVLWMIVSSQIDGSYAQILLHLYGWIALIPVALLLGVISISGDLFESLLKRKAQVKDSSALLPGHGGVYDRIDAVIAVVPVAYWIVVVGA